MRTEEGALKHKIKLHLAGLGAYFFMPVQTGYGVSTLDILCCINGKFVGIETKALGEKPSARQNLCMQQISKAGGIAIWCDTFDSYLTWMRAIGLIPDA